MSERIETKELTLSERLRDPELYVDACDEAADRLEKLEKDRERLRKAIKQIAKLNHTAEVLNPSMTMIATEEITRAAMEAKQ